MSTPTTTPPDLMDGEGDRWMWCDASNGWPGHDGLGYACNASIDAPEHRHMTAEQIAGDCDGVTICRDRPRPDLAAQAILALLDRAETAERASTSAVLRFAPISDTHLDYAERAAALATAERRERRCRKAALRVELAAYGDRPGTRAAYDAIRDVVGNTAK